MQEKNYYFQFTKIFLSPPWPWHKGYIFLMASGVKYLEPCFRTLRPLANTTPQNKLTRNTPSYIYSILALWMNKHPIPGTSDSFINNLTVFLL